jgi:alkaline phosphatase D
MNDISFTRRDFLRTTTLAGILPALSRELVGNQDFDLGRERLSVPASGRTPGVQWGVRSGDVNHNSATVWSATDRLARMEVEYSTRPSFSDSKTVISEVVGPDSCFTKKLLLPELPAGETISYRVRFRDVSDAGLVSPFVEGSFKTPAMTKQNIRVAWTADVVGNGYGINKSFGGLRIFDTILRTEPDVLLEIGDTIYADHPLVERKSLLDGSVWENVVTDYKLKIAETQEEFWGVHQYNRLDENMLRIGKWVPSIVSWNDHEVVNNWAYQHKVEDPRYRETLEAVLAQRGKKAFSDFSPTTVDSTGIGQLYRKFSYGPGLDIFRLDTRSYRGPNSDSISQESKPYFGATQISWIKSELQKSSAVWKVISCDMPIGLVVEDGPENCDNNSNRAHSIGGREFEVADLLSFIKREEIKNIVFLTADVHYAACYHYHPERAQFKNFSPFYEFVAGPAMASGWGPYPLDETFGPKAIFETALAGSEQDRSPTAENLYFGLLELSRTDELSVSLRNTRNQKLFEISLAPV